PPAAQLHQPLAEERPTRFQSHSSVDTSLPHDWTDDKITARRVRAAPRLDAPRPARTTLLARLARRRWPRVTRTETRPTRCC
ncbi:hypothetical protein PFISCL1PPCAC_11493, partial [Pristionchus fissidentatus]